uniref:CCHC-type domain-containing protein n=1 Tax=Cyclopterus lumpus TaxID=8103 RepID=A0A8C2ZR72_CYCLU
ASLALSGDRDEVSLEVTDEIIYKVLEGVKVGGRCKIRGRCLDRVGKKQFVLVETTDDMTKGDIPEQLAAGDGEELWIVNVSETHKWHVPREHEGFQTKLLAFLANEGKTVADVTGLFSSTPAPTPALDLNTQLVNAISSLVEKCQATPADSLGYRKLRLFSGIKPTPLGEEEYDSWAEQTTRMLDEWQCSDVIKKQRVAESLKGPAADIVRGAADLMGKFRTTFQRGGEKLSAYLLRLDKLLHAVHRRGGMEVADMNQVRIEQVARGALSNDFAALRIRLTYKLKPPPSFTELLRDIREEEEMILERLSVPTAGSRVECSIAAVAPVRPAPVSDRDPAIESLLKEFQGLKNDVARLLSASAAVSQSAPQHVAQSHNQKPNGNAYARGRERSLKPPYRVDVFCYRCGEDGHFQRECANPENLRKVNKRLLNPKQSAGNFSGAQ